MAKRWLIFGIGALMIIAFIIGCGERYSARQLWDLGLEKQGEKNWEEAINYYSRLLEAYPQDSLASLAAFAIGDVYLNDLKDYSKAVDSYRKVVEEYANRPEGPKAQFMIGYIYANSVKDYDKAREAYSLFLKIYPNHELKPSVEFEMKNLGKNLEEIPELKNITVSE